MPQEPIGNVTHYFGKPGVAVVKLSAELKLGERVRFVGHTTDFEQDVSSMEVEHGRVESAATGDEIAVKVDERVRQGDEVLRVTPD